MSTYVKRAALIGCSLILLAMICVALLPDSVWKGLIIRSVSHATGRQASIAGNVTVHIFSWHPRLIVEGFSLANAEWAGSIPLLSIRRFDITLQLSSVLRSGLIFPRIGIEEPDVDLERDAAGRVNWDFSASSSGKPQKPANALHIPVIQHLTVTDGSLSVHDKLRKLNFEGRIAVDERQNAPERSELDVRGAGLLNARPFDLHIVGAPLLSVDHSQPYTLDAAMNAADIKLKAHVDIAHPFDLGSVRAKVELSARNLADMYYLTGLALPNTPPYRISGTVERHNLVFTVDDLHGTIGGSEISGRVSVATDRARPKLTASLTSKELNLADLAVPLGAGPAANPASNAAHSLSPPLPTSTQWLFPDADLQVDRVRGMDADVTFDAASVTTAKIPLSKVHFHLDLDDGKLVLAPLAFTLPQGQFSGTVAIDARGETPQTQIDMRLTNVDLEQFKSKSSSTPPLQGQLLGRIHLRGSGSSVHKAAANADGDLTMVIPRGQMRAVLAELTGIDLSRGLGLFLTKNDATTEVRCGVANFHAARGDLTATALLVDTTHVLITGRGHVDLDREQLDLSLRGQPKEARLLRLRSPITVTGSLLHPRVGVDAGKALAQAGGATALGVLLTPLAAVLAFVDGGLAKDANCAALLTPVEQAHGLRSTSH